MVICGNQKPKTKKENLKMWAFSLVFNGNEKLAAKKIGKSKDGAFV